MNALREIKGVVQEGHKRGKKFGFPTMNFPLREPVSEGIYLSHIVIAKKRYNALTFIGAVKTFNETEFLAETYVFDFDKDVYGEMVSVMLLKKIRDNQKFASEEELITQMEEDKRQAIAYFAQQDS